MAAQATMRAPGGTATDLMDQAALGTTLAAVTHKRVKSHLQANWTFATKAGSRLQKCNNVVINDAIECVITFPLRMQEFIVSRRSGLFFSLLGTSITSFPMSSPCW